jgi:cysteine desulfurase/selenocysteine lyase
LCPSTVGNSLGAINPAGDLVSLARVYGISVPLDGAQSAPHMRINVQA